VKLRVSAVDLVLLGTIVLWALSITVTRPVLNRSEVVGGAAIVAGIVPERWRRVVRSPGPVAVE
jgi:hypothetical protein